MQSKKIILSLIAALAFTAGPATASDVYSVDTFAIGTLINGQFKVDSKEKAEACYKILNDETRRLEYSRKSTPSKDSIRWRSSGD